jgi:ATP-dependent protease Clp ATPase subunit
MSSQDTTNRVEKIFCSFCGKGQTQVRCFVAGWAGRQVYICDECIIRSAQIMTHRNNELRAELIAALSPEE